MPKARNIIIHCSDTPNGRGDDAEDIRRWHTDPKPKGNGWNAPGYHFVIPVSGERQSLVPIDDDEFVDPWEIANGARGHNHNSIHICLIGRDRFTREQWDSLGWLVGKLNAQFPAASACGHCDLDPVNKPHCPGFDVQAWLKDPAAVEAAHLLNLGGAA